MPNAPDIALLISLPNSETLLAAGNAGMVYPVYVPKTQETGFPPSTLPSWHLFDARVTALACCLSEPEPSHTLGYVAAGGADGSLAFALIPKPNGAGLVFLKNLRANLPPSKDLPVPSVEALRLSADGRTALVLARGGALFAIFFEPDMGPPKRILIPPALLAELTPDGRRLVAVDASNIVRVYDLRRDDAAVSEIAEIHGHGDVVHMMALSPDGRYLASASLDGRLRLTDLNMAVRCFRLPLYATPAAPAAEPMMTWRQIAPNLPAVVPKNRGPAKG